MFETKVYVERRKQLKKKISSGLILFLGNEESPMNYPANTFAYRQDSTFLYYWGIDSPGFAALIDADSGEETVFGYDFEIDDIIWMGPQEKLADKAKRIGVAKTSALNQLETAIKDGLRTGRRIHYLPQYRFDNIIRMERLSGIHTSLVNDYASKELIAAVVAQRSIKSEAEIEQIEMALDVSYDMYALAMKQSQPGMVEREIAGAVEGLALSRGCLISFPVIFTIHGEVLHGHSHHNVMKDGDLLILDSGAESPLHYASDITRTFPVGKKFTPAQRDIYTVVLNAQLAAIEMMKPRVPFKDVHLTAAKTIARGMKDLGFMKGNTDDAVSAGAHALFFPHGLGHQLGLDVHDMESLGENFVGYDATVKRSDQFGLAYLRFARKLEPGLVLTVEPGIYFMPELIGFWKSQGKFTEFINYEAVEKTIGLGGIRIEDDVLITKNGHRVLGKPIPKSIDDIEALKL
ncbi:MAG: aminopeptidase P family protein [Candidatus Zhuqueibacterota bacterium]